jgi:hypothetical protein
MEPIRDCKRRKRVSEAEKAATEISKIVCELYKLVPRHSQESHVRFENSRVVFTQSKLNNVDAEACNLSDHRQRPCYCARAEFKFEASLPDRDHLTRFSVRFCTSRFPVQAAPPLNIFSQVTCAGCRASGEPVFHLYCSYCDEILTGSIAQPGGKVADHVITIRHARTPPRHHRSQNRLPHPGILSS